jgi:hypothetical protein
LALFCVFIPARLPEDYSPPAAPDTLIHFGFECTCRISAVYAHFDVQQRNDIALSLQRQASAFAAAGAISREIAL